MKAKPLESQLIDWIRDFAPDGDLRDFLLSSVDTATAPGDDAERRRALTTQLERLQFRAGAGIDSRPSD